MKIDLYHEGCSAKMYNFISYTRKKQNHPFFVHCPMSLCKYLRHETNRLICFARFDAAMEKPNKRVV